jgi:hypothetical protein
MDMSIRTVRQQEQAFEPRRTLFKKLKKETYSTTVFLQRRNSD